MYLFKPVFYLLLALTRLLCLLVDLLGAEIISILTTHVHIQQGVFVQACVCVCEEESGETQTLTIIQHIVFN